MASFNYYLRSKHNQYKESTLYLYVTLSRSERITLNTGIKAKAKNWNNKQKCFRSSEVGAPEKNAELKKLKAKLELAYMAHRDLTLEQLKIRLQEVIHPVIGRQKNIPTISEALEVFMQDMAGVYSYDYLRGYQQVINFVLGKKVKTDQVDQKISQVRNLPINKIGSKYLQKYNQWMVAESFQNASIAKHLKFIKKILNVNADLYELDASYAKVKKIKLRQSKPFWLDHSEIKLLIQYCFSNKRKQHVADEWLFRYYTGLRDQDSRQIEKHHIKKIGDTFYLDFNMLKNRRDFLLPLSSAAYKMLESYNFALPKQSQTEKNNMIKLCFKEVGLNDLVENITISGSNRMVELVPKWKKVTTHTARKSFGRRWMDTIGDIESLSQYLGHSSSAVTRHYIGWQLEEYADFVRQIDFS